MKRTEIRINSKCEKVFEKVKEERIIPVKKVKRELCPEIMDERSVNESIDALKSAGLLDVRKVVWDGSRPETCLILLKDRRKRRRLPRFASRPRLVHCRICGRPTMQKMIDQRIFCIRPESCMDLLENPPIIAIFYHCHDCGAMNREWAPTILFGKIGRNSSSSPGPGVDNQGGD